jgi:16S rRNA G966 N2-methylase RsmD
MVKINEEFKSLIPPIHESDYKELEESLVEEGCRDPLTLWKDFIIDGHNRFEICSRLKISFKTRDKEFKDVNDVKLWIIKNQLSRRNLNDYQRIKLVLAREPLITAKAKEHQSKGGGSVHQKSDKPTETLKELAKQSNVSHDTVHKVKVVEEHADKKTKDALESGELSINQAYKKARTKKKRMKSTSKPEEIKLSEVLLSGDCLIELNKVKDKSIDLVYVDPPYNILSKEKASWDSLEHKDYVKFTEKWLTTLLPKLKDTGKLFVSFSQENMWWFQELLEKHSSKQELELINLIVWNYKNNIKPSSRYAFKHTWEPIFYYKKKDAPELNKVNAIETEWKRPINLSELL